MLKVFLVELQTETPSSAADYLTAEANITVVEHVHSETEAIASLHRCQLNRQLPDVLLLKSAFTTQYTLFLIRYIRYQLQGLRTLLMVNLDDEVMLARLMQLGIEGCVSLDIEKQDFISAVRSVAQGYSYVDSRAIQRSLSKLTARSNTAENIDRANIQTKLSKLSSREQEVLFLLSDGKTNQEIARALYIAEKTVKNHITSIFKKLKITSRTQAALLVQQMTG